MGLDVPQVTRIFMALRALGFDLSQSVYTIEQGKEEILRYLREVSAR